MIWTVSKVNRAWSTFIVVMAYLVVSVSAYPHFQKESYLYDEDPAAVTLQRRSDFLPGNGVTEDDDNPGKISRKESIKCGNFEVQQHPLNAQLCRLLEKRSEFLLMPLVDAKDSSRQSDEKVFIKSKKSRSHYAVRRGNKSRAFVDEVPDEAPRDQSQKKNELEPIQEEGSWTCKSVPYTICFSLDHKGQVLDVRRFKPFRMNKIYR